MPRALVCPRCGNNLQINDWEPTAHSWSVCPACQYANFILTAEVETYNSSIAEEIAKGPTGLFPEVSTRTLLSIQAADFAKNRIGKLGRWTAEQYDIIGEALCGPEIKTVRMPPFLCIDTAFRNTMKPYMFSASRKRLENPDIAGINVPLFQEQDQYVGHCTLIKPYPEACSSFSWKTYLHEFYGGRERAFLSYRPGPVTSMEEILLVDNFTAYIQAVRWYDTAPVELTPAFPRRVVPVLVLGKKPEALQFLADYAWRPARITVVSPFQDLSSEIWDRIQSGHFFHTKELRIASSNTETMRYIRKCRSKDEFEDIILDRFFNLGESYDKNQSQDGEVFEQRDELYGGHL